MWNRITMQMLKSFTILSPGTSQNSQLETREKIIFKKMTLVDPLVKKKKSLLGKKEFHKILDVSLFNLWFEQLCKVFESSLLQIPTHSCNEVI